MKIEEVISPELVIYDLSVQNREEAIERMADHLLSAGVITDKASYISAVDERETDGTTGIGDGIAIPHGKAKSVTRSAVVIAKLKKPVEWHALDDQPVQYVFLLAIPEGGDNEHLKLLSELASKLMDDDVHESLKQATSEADLERIFEG